MPFDPDKFLEETDPAKVQKKQIAPIVNQAAAFDPDKFLAETEPVIDPDTEASIGTLRRLQYSIEPLASNRRAFLTKEYGAENVKEDANGNIYVNQGGVFRPVNVEGASMADIADVIGSLPENVGSAVGAVGGAIAGGGVGSIPAAIGLGAAGGAVGSAARQGFSALLGTPQVAKPIERATEIGLSGLFGGVGGGVGAAVGKGVRAAAPKVTKLFPSFDVSKEGKKMMAIAKKEAIPMPTPGQAAGGYDFELEQLATRTPFFGGKLRKTVDSQVKAIKENLAKVAGEFGDKDSVAGSVGFKAKDAVRRLIKTTKQTSGKLFDDVAAEGYEAVAPANQVKSEVLGQLQKIGLFDLTGKPIPHSSKTGLTATQFDRVQGIFGRIIKDIDASATDFVDGVITPGQKGQFINADTLNTMRKFIDANIKEGSKQGLDDVVLIKMRDSFLDATENILGSKDAGLKTKFKAARALWAKQLDMKSKAKSIGINLEDTKSLADEKVIARIFSDSKNVKAFKEISDDTTVKEVGTAWINDLLSSKLGKESQRGAAAALKTVKQNKSQIIESLGAETYNKIRNNLFYLDKIGETVNPSKTFLAELMTVTPKSIATGAATSANRAMRNSVRNITSGAIKGTKELPKKGSRLLNILTDPTQSEAAYFTRGPRGRRPSEDKEGQK